MGRETKVYRHRTSVTAATLVLFALVLGVAALRGARGRVVLPERTTVAVRSPEDAYAAWKEKGVRGRILLLFDRYPHLDLPYASYRTGARPDAVNFLDFAIFESIVRKIYFVVPEASWAEFRRNEHIYQPFRRVIGARRALYLLVNDYSGISLVAAAPSSLPRTCEKVLVYVNAELFDAREVADLLARMHIATDFMVVLQNAGAT